MSTPLDHGFKGYRSYGSWLRGKFGGKRVCKVIVDAGFSCPNRDGSKGYGGCAYCNVDSFTPALPRSIDDIRGQVSQGIARARKHYGAEKFIIYFQPNTNTHAPVEMLRGIYDKALSVCPEDVVGLAVGTRPDCLDAEKIALLESYADRLEVDLELGMESIHDETLDGINRGCRHGELVALLESLADSPLNLCIHTIFGLPGETRAMMLACAGELNRFPQVRFVKLHHLHVVKGSILAARYQKEPFPVFSLEEYTDFLCGFLPLLRPDIVIQRLFGVADPSLLIAPQWKLPKAAVQSHIDREIQRRGIVQGSRLAGLA
ncbi:MAG: TIGR01212 family radical SAM protein [Verrucomicrobiaceae bacterium]|nr:MAG: TIGR01212 family radical SAM protein [Verrucomicrobiaceae bacterium]